MSQRLTKASWPARNLTDEEISSELEELERRWDNVRSGDGHGGSPGEWIAERMWELEDEQKRRKSQ